MKEVRTCLTCGAAFTRKPRETNARWDRRSCCTRSCTARHRAANGGMDHIQAGWKRYIADPVNREAHRARSIANVLPHQPKAAAARRALLDWCPESLRDDYRLMVRSGMPAAEARALLEPTAGAQEVARISANLLAAEQKRRRDAY